MEKTDLTDLPSYENKPALSAQQTADSVHNQQFTNQISPHGGEFVVDSGKGALIADDDDDNLLVVNTHPPNNILGGVQGMQLQSGIGVPPVAEQPMTLVKCDRYPLSGLFCTTCHRVYTTMIKQTYQSSAWAWFGILCCFAGLLSAAIPFLRQDMKKTVHSCPYCGSVVGVYAPKMKKETLAMLIAALIVGLGVSAFVVYWAVTNFTLY